MRREQAAKLFRKAEEHYKLNRFHQAMPLYIKAYEILRLPAFLFNIGQCHRMLGNYNMALFYFKGYLRSSDYIPQRESVERLIQKILKLVAAKERRAEEAGRGELETKWRALRAKQRELERQRKSLGQRRRKPPNPPKTDGTRKQP
jgi:tetratricopeptide (TPR) repeat protein